MSKKQTSSDYRQLIREAAELLDKTIGEFSTPFSGNPYIDMYGDDDDEFTYFDHGEVCEYIMKKECKHNSILWETALITVLESAMLSYNKFKFGVDYYEPDIKECESKYKYFKKLISKKRNPKIKIKFDGVLEKVDGMWHFNM